MADKQGLADKDQADAAAEEQAAIEDAVTPADTPAARDGIAKARDAELARQADVEKAVAKANEKELPKLGGDLLEPGLGH